jgi:hypothetical protein
MRFVQENIELFYYLMNDELLLIWNTKGKISLLDKFKKILGILVYNNDNYYTHEIKNIYSIPNIIKPSIIVKYIDKNDITVFY